MQKSKVLIIGTFHFDNPKRDYVKNDVIDVLSSESQHYLSSLAYRICEFRPEAILLEYDKENDYEINANYTQYCHDNYELGPSEIEQLGFRIAKLCELKRVESFDEREILWKSEELFTELKNHPVLEQEFNEKIAEITANENKDQKNLSLRDLLIKYNGKEFDDLNKSLYLMTNLVGAGDSYSGADATASWWHRNFRMLAKIQKAAKSRKRLVVIAGQGHTAILKDLIELDPSLEVEDIQLYL